jgi:hypothetical protein
MTASKTFHKYILHTVANRNKMIALIALMKCSQCHQWLKFIRHNCKSVQEVYKLLGDEDFWKTYHMLYPKFTKLASMLEDGIVFCTGASGKPHHYTNGYISPDVRLAIALGYFAGGRLWDLMTTYHVGRPDA